MKLMSREHRRRGTLLLAALLAVACLAAASAPAVDVSVEQARTLVDSPKGKLAVLDVRTPQEFAAGHLRRARNVNVMAADFERRVRQLDRGTPYLVYCRTGNRSAKAVRLMEQLGFTTLYHMVDGIVGWQGKRFPLVK